MSWADPTKPIYDSAGNKHVEIGLHTSRATFIVFVYFDDFPGMGQMIHIACTSHVKRLMIGQLRAGELVCLASKSGSKIFNTGAGYKHTMEELQAVSYPLREHPDDTGLPIVERSMRAVEGWLDRHGFKHERTSGRSMNQIKQIDLFAWRDGSWCSFEVKCRDVFQRYEHAFCQTSETNPNRDYGR